MTEADDALGAMQNWLTGLSAADEAVDDVARIEREVAALLTLVELGVGERLRIEAAEALDDAYVAALEGAVNAIGATLGLIAAAPVDALVSFETALGIEGKDEDVTLLREACAALRTDGRYFLDLPNRESVVHEESRNRVFSAIDGRMYLERSEFDYASGRHRVTVTEMGFDGSRREIRESSRRLYALTELIALLEAAGLKFEAVYGGFEGEAYGPDTPRMVVLARKGDV